jgi:Uma2 family endonuclease
VTAARTSDKRTIADLLALPDDARMELIDGVLVPRDANPSPDHGYAQASLTSTLFSRFSRGGGGGGGDAPGGWWIATEVHVAYGAHTACVDDVVGWRRERSPRRPTDVPVTLRPDWVCEILSTNRSNDLVVKMNVLRDAGVPHYWIVDPTAGVLTVHRLAGAAWTVALSAGRNERVRAEPFEAVEVETNELFGE